MKYMGSKNRISKQLLPIILDNRANNQWYVEPFVGGANMIDKVTGNRIGADSNYWLIKALEYIRDCSLPCNNESFTEYNYMDAANYARGNKSKPFDDRLVGYSLFAFSFGAKWIGGWSRGKTSNGNQRDYVAEQFRANNKQKPLLDGVDLVNSCFKDLHIPADSIIYCDPPYEGTTKYKDGDFPHNDFWQWCRDKAKDGHKVYISEYNAPSDFICVWEYKLKVSVAKEGRQKIAIEKLFIHESQIIKPEETK